MYRCHFMQAGRIVQGLNLKVETLDAAIATGRKILADHIELIDCDGLEIWLDSALLYKFSLFELRTAVHPIEGITRRPLNRLPPQPVSEHQRFFDHGLFHCEYNTYVLPYRCGRATYKPR